MATAQRSPRRLSDPAKQLSSLRISGPSSDGHNGVPVTDAVDRRVHPTAGSDTRSPSLSPFLRSPVPITHLYVVTKTYLVRIGKDAAIEAPAIRQEVLAVCFSAERAREIARLAWRRAFAYGVPEDKTEEFDGLGVERMFGRGDTEVFSVTNANFRCEEDGVEVLAGERRVAVWRVRMDCEEGGGEVEDGGRTPSSE